MAAWLHCCMVAWFGLVCGLAVAYIFIISRYITGWRQLPAWSIPSGFSPSVKISVIVPARNEAANLPACLDSISKQTCPASLFEVIVLDDHSTDGTFPLAQQFAQAHPNVRAVRLADHLPPGGAPSFKKKAIETGITLATGELIVTTDADCIVQPDWLLLLASFFEEKRAKFIAAPVNFHQEKNGLQRFSSLDFLGMMGITGAGFQHRSGLLCNGANLAYPKAVFYEVGGFENIAHLASGDDMLLLHKIAARWPGGVFFLKNRNATVFTEAPADGRAFVSQRLRWASKSTSYQDKRVTLALGVVFLLCWAIVLHLLLAVWWGWLALAFAAFLLVVKSTADFIFLREMARYFGRPDLMKSYLRSQCLHIAYIIGVGTLANFVKRYEWKGRRVQ
ncbi:MAG: glycosyltransferase [Bacteroidetes bacterium]|nr:glycosyltransferase [Bacteroidota bacterium]